MTFLMVSEEPAILSIDNAGSLSNRRLLKSARDRDRLKPL